MNTNKAQKSNFPPYLLMIFVGLLLGCLLALFLYFIDKLDQNPTPLRDGQTIDLTPFGFTLQVPQNFSISDITETSNSLLTLALGNEQDSFFIYCYPNDEQDNIEDYSHLEMVRYYMKSGCDQVQPRTFGGRTFICYRALIKSLTGDEDWYVYETWDPDQHLIFETRMLPVSILPILATLQFTHPAEPVPGVGASSQL